MAAACASNPATPQQTGPVRLSAHLDRTQIGAGHAATVTFRLQNTAASPITLDFSSGCQLMTTGEGSPPRIVLPRGEYEFYARVESRQYKLESNRVTLTVQ